MPAHAFTYDDDQAMRYHTDLRADTAALEQKARSYYATIRSTLPLLQLPMKTDDLSAIQERAATIRKQASRVIILGTGGSSLAGRSLLPMATDDGLPITIVDSIDPESVARITRQLDAEDAHLIISSKSGWHAGNHCASRPFPFLFCRKLGRKKPA